MGVALVQYAGRPADLRRVCSASVDDPASGIHGAAHEAAVKLEFSQCQVPFGAARIQFDGLAKEPPLGCDRRLALRAAVDLSGLKALGLSHECSRTPAPLRYLQEVPPLDTPLGREPNAPGVASRWVPDSQDTPIGAEPEADLAPAGGGDPRLQFVKPEIGLAALDAGIGDHGRVAQVAITQ